MLKRKHRDHARAVIGGANTMRNTTDRISCRFIPVPGFFLFGQSKIPRLFQVFSRFVDLFQGLGKIGEIEMYPSLKHRNTNFLQYFLYLTQSDLP